MLSHVIVVRHMRIIGTQDSHMSKGSRAGDFVKLMSLLATDVIALAQQGLHGMTQLFGLEDNPRTTFY